MAGFRKELTDFIRPHLKDAKFPKALVDGIDAILDRAGVPRDGAPAASPPPAPAPKPRPPAPPPAPAGRLDVAGLRAFLGLGAAGAFDDKAKQALLARLSNRNAPALTAADFDRAAAQIGVPAKAIMAVRKVEVRASPFDAQGRPTILYERHVFTRNTIPKGRFNASNPKISGGPYGKGGYGPVSAQYGKLADACALDPEAAFRGCSWGAFQILGENAADIGYASAFEMALSLTASEAAHLESFLRFVRSKKLIGALRACRAGDPQSCVPFVKGYNGAGFAEFAYHRKLAEALK